MTDVNERLATALADRYRIERRLGEGGMATVYLAEDLKHKRNVAVKVLRPELAAVLGAERFVQEITTTASLQHPNILPLFDSGEADGFLYYVMPYVEGETLRDKLNRETQLAVDEAVKLTAEVAEALDYAHRQGIIHRDIKPENILLHDGRPTVADFGIALAVSAAAGGRMTETGLSLGTPHYMSPEQATAEKDLTARSDVYSLGSVLYEMLTGSPPHVGASAQQIIMKIVTEEAAPITQLRKSVPSNVAAAVAEALEKLPADRFDTAAAFAAALRSPAFTRATPTHDLPVGLRPARARLALPLLVVVLLLAAVAGWLRPGGGPAAADRTIVRSTIVLPDSAPMTAVGEATFGIGRAALALSPAGDQLVYVAEVDGRTLLYHRRMEEFDVQPLPGTEGAFEPFFSPDGAWVAFFSANRLRKVSVAGGVSIDLAEAPQVVGGAWGDDGRIYLTPNEGRTISWVPEGGGEERVLATVPSAGLMFGFPHKVPGEPWLLAATLLAETFAVSTETGQLVSLGQRLPNPRVAGNALLYSAQSTLMMVPFDPESPAIVGPPSPALSGVRTEAAFGVGQYALSRAGTLVYVPGQSGDLSRLGFVDSLGAFEALPFEPRRFGALALDPSGTRLAVIEDDVEDHLWQYDFARGERRRLSTGGTNLTPTWRPDGSRVTWTSMEDGRYRIVERAAAGGGEPRILHETDIITAPSDWSPDGRALLVFELDMSGEYPDYDIAVYSPDDGTMTPFVADPYNTWGASFSPDGRYVAYTSDESGEYEIWVESFPATGERWQVSTGGGNEEPVWSRGGDRLYFRGGTIWKVVDVTLGDGFAFGTPRELFRGPYINVAGFSYDVRPDARAVVLRDAGQRLTTELRLVTHWLDGVGTAPEDE